MGQVAASGSFNTAEPGQNGAQLQSTNLQSANLQHTHLQSTNGHNLDVQTSGQADADSELSEERELGK